MSALSSGVFGPSASPTPTTHTRRLTRRTLPNPTLTCCGSIRAVSLAELIRPLSAELARHFADAPVPVALQAQAAPGSPGDADPPHLYDPSQRIVILAGELATLDQPALHALADRLGAPVANTWGAKGIYAWDDPHHMGTCGLQ